MNFNQVKVRPVISSYHEQSNLLEEVNRVLYELLWGQMERVQITTEEYSSIRIFIEEYDPESSLYSHDIDDPNFVEWQSEYDYQEELSIIGEVLSEIGWDLERNTVTYCGNPQMRYRHQEQGCDDCRVWREDVGGCDYLSEDYYLVLSPEDYETSD